MFKTWEEEAEFWDTHDFTEFNDLFTVVRRPTGKVHRGRKKPNVNPSKEPSKPTA